MYVSAVNFLDHFQEKAGWKAWKGNRRRKHVYSTCTVSCFRGAKAEPHQNITATVAVCLSMHLHMIFSYIWLRKFTTEMLLFPYIKKIFIYLYVWSADCNSAIYSELQYMIMF